jgi:hypothetical protein
MAIKYLQSVVAASVASVVEAMYEIIADQAQIA